MFDRRTPLKREIDAASPIILHHFMLKCCIKANDFIQYKGEQTDALIQNALHTKAKWLIGEASRAEVWECQKECKEIYKYFNDQVNMGRLPLAFWYWGAAMEHLCTTSMERKNIEKRATNTIDACRFVMTLKNPTLGANLEFKQQQANELRELHLRYEKEAEDKMLEQLKRQKDALTEVLFT